MSWIVLCADYCDFAKSCLGDNTLASSALPDVIKGLHADDTAACTSSCKKDLADDGAGDPVVSCVEAGRKKAACAGDTSQTGLTAEVRGFRLTRRTGSTATAGAARGGRHQSASFAPYVEGLS